jgi:UDP-N-acetylglucosamine 2-epimerase (non-hydrolysing)
MAPQVCFVVGARPNFVKAAPVLQALRELDPNLGIRLVHTGQHYDPEMSDVFIDELRLPVPDVQLEIGSGGHGEQTARALEGLAAIFQEESPDLVVVAGDVNSTLAAALAAVKLSIPVAHIESGLRSFDPTMPEEHNRKLTDHVSSVLFVHSTSAIDNLDREGIDPASVHLVGNTMIDSLLARRPAALEAQPWARFGVPAHEYGLVTLHRPSLVDDPALLDETMQALTRLARAIPLIFPVHPRTLDRLAHQGLDRIVAGTNLRLTGPLSYTTFLGLEAAARFVLTDSGGVQEETSALGVPCFTLRSSTERPVTTELGTNTLLGMDPARITEIPELLPSIRSSAQIPLWDGHAGERAAGVIARFLESTEALSEVGA